MDDIKVTKGRGNSVTAQQAQEFVKRLEAGEEPTKAALEVGTSIFQLKRDPRVLAVLEALRHWHFPDPDQREAIVQAKMMEVMLNPDNSPRDQVAAAKVLLPEQKTEIVINLSDEIKNMEDAPLTWAEREK